MQSRFPLLAAGIAGVTGVGLGAFGAHALRAHLTELGTLHNWETAVHYHLAHAVALLAAGVWVQVAKPRGAVWAQRAAKCWAVGVLLFSGSLYGLALGGPRVLGPITPLGGVAFLAGWTCVILAAYAKEE